MPPKGHLSDKENRAILALHLHSVSQKDIDKDICRHPTTGLRFLDQHKRVVRQSLLKNAIKILIRTFVVSCVVPTPVTIVRLEKF